MGWRERATKVEQTPPATAGGWRSRAAAVEVAPAPVVAPEPQPQAPEEVDATTGMVVDQDTLAKLRGKPERGAGEAALSGWNAGALKEWADEAAGSGYEQLTKLRHSLRGQPLTERAADDAYRFGRDTTRKAMDEAREANPKLSAAAGIAGDVASDFVASKLGLPVGSAAYQVAMGMLTGAGASDGDLTNDKRDAGEVARVGGNAALGGAMAYVAPKALTAIGRKGVRAARELKDFAAERALKALGGHSDLNAILNRGQEYAREVGRDLLDSGTVGFGTHVDTAAKRLADLKNHRGTVLGGLIDMIDDRALKGDKLDVNRLADALEKKLLTGLPANEGSEKVIRAEIDKLRQWAAPRVATEAGGLYQGLQAPETARLGLREAEELLKRPAQSLVNYEKKVRGPNQEALSRVASAIREATEEHADDVVMKRAPDLAGEFKPAKEAYGRAAAAADVAESTLERNLKNRWASPSDYAAGMAGAAQAAQQPPTVTAAAWMLANRVMRGRGSSAMAVTADKLGDLAKKIDAIPRIFSKFGDVIGTYGVRELLREYPGAFETIFQGGSPPEEEAPAP